MRGILLLDEFLGFAYVNVKIAFVVRACYTACIQSSRILDHFHNAQLLLALNFMTWDTIAELRT